MSAIKRIPEDRDPQEYVREVFGPRAYIPKWDEYKDAAQIGYVEFEGGPRGVFAVIELPEDGGKA